jgi:hypothetical protein
MLKFKTFDIIMILLQTVASSIGAYWGFKWAGKSSVFYHLTALGLAQVAFSVVVSLDETAVLNLVFVGGSVLIFSEIVR